MSVTKVFLITAVAALLFAGCQVDIVTPPPTTVKAENDLTNLSIDVQGTTTNVDAIDLANVYIGNDVFFSYVEAGYTTGSKTTHESGKVTIDIDTAIVVTKVLGVAVELPFTNINSMSATIESNTANTVVFDQTSAGVIFSTLAKKK